MKFIIKNRNLEDTMKILNWHFKGIYSIYNNDTDNKKISNIISLADSEDAFFIYDEDGELIGNCEFYNYKDRFCVGLQMKPDMTGKGFGMEFVKAIIMFGKGKYNIAELHLYVAAFNKRAVRVYEKVGFKVRERFILRLQGKAYKFIEMSLKYADIHMKNNHSL